MEVPIRGVLGAVHPRLLVSTACCEFRLESWMQLHNPGYAFLLGPVVKNWLTQTQDCNFSPRLGVIS